MMITVMIAMIISQKSSIFTEIVLINPGTKENDATKDGREDNGEKNTKEEVGIMTVTAVNQDMIVILMIVILMTVTIAHDEKEIVVATTELAVAAIGINAL